MEAVAAAAGATAVATVAAVAATLVYVPRPGLDGRDVVRVRLGDAFVPRVVSYRHVGVVRTERLSGSGHLSHSLKRSMARARRLRATRERRRPCGSSAVNGP